MDMIQTKSFTLSIYSQGDPHAEKLALVIPGKLDSKDFAHMHSHVDYLATKGFYALTFDPPGTWESPGDISLYTATNYVKAVNELIEYVGNKPTLLVGHSRGGKLAMIIGTQNPRIIAYVAIMSWLASEEETKKEEGDWKEGFYKTYRSLPPGTGERVKEFILPYSFHKDEIKYFLTDEIKKCVKPKMFIYGSQDTTVIPDKTKKTFDQLSEPKEIHSVNWYHEYWHSPKIIERINQLLGQFISTF